MRRAQDRARSVRSRKNGARSVTIKSRALGALKLASEAGRFFVLEYFIPFFFWNSKILICTLSPGTPCIFNMNKWSSALQVMKYEEVCIAFIFFIGSCSILFHIYFFQLQIKLIVKSSVQRTKQTQLRNVQRRQHSQLNVVQYLSLRTRLKRIGGCAVALRTYSQDIKERNKNL